MKDKIIELLLSTKREGMEKLIRHMEEMDFFTAPCSSQYHLCKVGGLAEHSLNVYRFGSMVIDDLNITGVSSKIPSWTISSLLHDLGKASYHNKPNYVPNLLSGGKVSDKKPFTSNSERLYIAHETVSVLIASKFIELTEEEEFAILYHNGLYTASGRDIQGKERPLQTLLHFADLYCSRFIESKGE